MPKTLVIIVASTLFVLVPTVTHLVGARSSITSTVPLTYHGATTDVFGIPRGGGFFNRNNNNNNNHKNSIKHSRNEKNDKNDDDDDDGITYPALTQDEIIEKLNIPIYAITDSCGNGAVLSGTANDAAGSIRKGECVVYFFLSQNMALKALKNLKVANSNILDLKVTALHLGKVWFKLLHPPSPHDNKMELTAIGPEKHVTRKKVSVRLVPEIRDLIGARLLQGLDPEDVPKLRDAVRDHHHDTARELIQSATEKANGFQKPYDQIPVFMVNQLRIRKNTDDGNSDAMEMKFPMFLSPRTMMNAFNGFLEMHPEGKDTLEPTLQLADLRTIVEMMEGESKMDFRNVVLVPDVDTDGDSENDNNDDDDDRDGGDVDVNDEEEYDSEDFEYADDNSPYPYVSIEMGVYESGAISDDNGMDYVSLQ